MYKLVSNHLTFTQNTTVIEAITGLWSVTVCTRSCLYFMDTVSEPIVDHDVVDLVSHYVS